MVRTWPRPSSARLVSTTSSLNRKTVVATSCLHESTASNTVTAVTVPEGVDASKLMNILRTEHEVVLSGGQKSLGGKIFRIGHLGYTTAEEIQEVLDALAIALPQVGFTTGAQA